MRKFRAGIVLLAVCVACGGVQAQSPAQAASAGVSGPSDLERAIVGAWVGTLEYRDYSEPPTSTKRVKLPTRLSVEEVGGRLQFSYVYDDGPTKTVTELSVVRIDAAAGRYEVADKAGKVTDAYGIEGLAQLKNGRGVLTLTGKGTENDAPVDVRMTLRVGRNILEMTRETAASGQAFTFRHAYTFVRATAPVVTPGN